MKSIAFHHWWIGGVHVESAFPQGVERKTHPIIFVHGGCHGSWGADPTLHHIGMALRAGIQSGDGIDRMYGEALSTALASHSYANIAWRCSGRKDSMVGCRAKS